MNYIFPSRDRLAVMGIGVPSEVAFEEIICVPGDTNSTIESLSAG
jgi:hypothetical protein